MFRIVRFALAFALTLVGGMVGAATVEDVIPTSKGDLTIGFVGHGSLYFRFGGKVFHVDPFGKAGDYATLPKADVVLITHDHGDHLDAAALAAIRQAKTEVIVAPICAGKVEGAMVSSNGESRNVGGVSVLAVPAYNLVHKRPDGAVFHPKGEGNGYLLSFGDKKVYVAGDTENTSEMKALTGVDIAFLPMNLPYTMTPEMVADAARAFGPKILYPYHFGDTDTSLLEKLLVDVKNVEVRIRPMK
jgi:L-ascorbate metabolism protein UlaG (beta-lactamase superfamily)